MLLIYFFLVFLFDWGVLVCLLLLLIHLLDFLCLLSLLCIRHKFIYFKNLLTNSQMHLSTNPSGTSPVHGGLWAGLPCGGPLSSCCSPRLSSGSPGTSLHPRAWNSLRPLPLLEPSVLRPHVSPILFTLWFWWSASSTDFQKIYRR